MSQIGKGMSAVSLISILKNKLKYVIAIDWIDSINNEETGIINWCSKDANEDNFMNDSSSGPEV